MQSFGTEIDIKEPLRYKSTRAHLKRNYLLYGAILFVLFAVIFLCFKYISTISQMKNNIKELSSRLDKAMIQLKALQETIKDNKEYDESYGHLKSLFDN